VVTCLESLEFMIHRADVVRELIRVLRPGGLLLISNRINTRAMPGKTWSQDELDRLLIEAGIELIEAEPWQTDYQKVWAIKAGDSPSTGARPLDEVLCCPQCRERLMVKQGRDWVCEGCGKRAKTSDDGVIALFPLYPANN
jgi:SAM-dependent methyltransferase